MQGNQQIIDRLNHLLTGELSAADQYFIHSRMYQDWGLDKLYERIAHEAQEELEHAEKLVERILFLEGTPNVAARDPLNIGTKVADMLNNDLALEYQVAAELKDAIAECESLKDFQTRNILLVLLKDTEEDHAYWLEQQLELIDKMGAQLYLQSQTG